MATGGPPLRTDISWTTCRTFTEGSWSAAGATGQFRRGYPARLVKVGLAGIQVHNMPVAALVSPRFFLGSPCGTLQKGDDADQSQAVIQDPRVRPKLILQG